MAEVGGSISFGVEKMADEGIRVRHGAQVTEYRAGEFEWRTADSGLAILVLPNGTEIPDPFSEGTLRG